MKKQTPGLSDAYALSTPEHSRRLYADWAGTYDQDFAAGQDYLLPGLTAKAFAAAGGTGPVLDVGAGTGLCGQALRALGVEPVDATDISAAMLAEALRKDVYRDVIEANLLEGIPVPRGSYRGVVSSGTFTHGHLGPEVLPVLLRVAAPDTWFALSVNTRFYGKAGFAAAFERLRRGQWIKHLTLPETRIYGPRATGTHKDDTALIAVFQKV
ncbi:class I SAM-dependent DNA methyltransferase [Leisingera thetidis]|uniref:class I SAM-dependent DNA methyltransferase n=1 Tax=Leisingera thetidis TaxID=2930199 RepID=UPI0021F6B34B|nr:class I SAM-dependent methyltransferase [Leisingera thetidis]